MLTLASTDEHKSVSDGFFAKGHKATLARASFSSLMNLPPESGGRIRGAAHLRVINMVSNVEDESDPWVLVNPGES